MAFQEEVKQEKYPAHFRIRQKNCIRYCLGQQKIGSLGVPSTQCFCTVISVSLQLRQLKPLLHSAFPAQVIKLRELEIFRSEKSFTDSYIRSTGFLYQRRNTPVHKFHHKTPKLQLHKVLGTLTRTGSSPDQQTHLVLAAAEPQISAGMSC